MVKKIVKEVQKGSDIQTPDKTRELLDAYNDFSRKYNALYIEINGLKSQLETNSNNITTLYGIVQGDSETPNSVLNSLKNLEKRLDLIEQIEASENINPTLEELKYIPPTKKIESSIPNTPTPQEYPAPSTSILDNAHEYRIYKRIWNALKGSQTKESESSKTAKWIIRGAAIVSLALGSYLGYLESTKDNKSSKPIKIEKIITLSENCPDMKLIYLNENDKDNLTKSLNSKEYTAYTLSKGYIILSSKDVCKNGTWDEEIYLFNKNHTDSIVNSILNDSKYAIEASKAFRNSLKLKSTKNVAKSTQQIKKAIKINKSTPKPIKQQELPRSDSVEDRFE